MSDINFIEIGKRIRIERERNAMTRDQLAEAVSISVVYLNQLERSERQGSIAVICKIASVLNISLDYLIYGNNCIEVNKEDIVKKISTLNNRELKVIGDILNLLPNHKK